MRSFSFLMLLLCFACQSGSEPGSVAPQAQDSSAAQVQAKVGERLDSLMRRLAVRPQATWTSVPYEGGERLVLLVLEHGGETARGEWRLSQDGKIVADSTFARELEAIPEAPTEGELMALVPRSWLPQRATEVVATEKPEKTLPQASPTPAILPQPEPAPKPKPKPAPKPVLTLTGVIAGDIQTAFFQLEERNFSAKPGETVAGVTVHTIEPQKAVVTFRGKRREMFVAMPLDAQLRSPKPRPPEEPDVIYLDNSDLDKTPPEVLPGGVRKL